ncbi:ribosome biogenesis GTPase Der [Blattabacterium cuenoti]|uniref:ribosome biogenesis GTPase Der n=1 Tax=Blattabacterium cuenoti TaxID=1653831 RepID=UPI00163B83BD|nr:ribosome biogenesis GTPase Der [Blattabacterium cuenoti]
MNYTVSIVGRPNVGKSTLFNRFVGNRKAIVHKYSGITRDSIFGYSEWNGIKFSVLDTGGYTMSNDFIQQEINSKIFESIDKSDIILFLIDITTGLLSSDIELANSIRKCKKPILLVINKVDHAISDFDIDFFCLGFNDYHYISAINGSGTGELLDRLVKILKKSIKITKKYNLEKIPKISIVGRPNTGKSTLINSLINKNHHIVTDIPGTTRDSLEVIYKKLKYECILIDTPGIIRKKSKDNIEFYSMTRAINTIESIDICLLMIDVEIGWRKHDMNILNIIKKNNKGIIILVNKWDLFYETNNFKKKYEIFIRKKIYPLNVPILFISAKNKYNITKIIPIAFKILKYSKKKLKTNILNKIMLPIFRENPPPSIRKYNKNKFIKIKYCTQLSSYNPKFVFFSNFPKSIKESYKRFIENKIRYHFDFKGVPIQIFFRKK